MAKKRVLCYACSNLKKTREHAPPLVFFPGHDEIPDGIDHRLNLIRVPSCDKHNLEKSKDDLYVFMIIVAQLWINNLGLEHYDRNVRPRIMENPKLKSFYQKNLRPVSISGKPTGIFEVDKERFDNFFNCLSKAIFFEEYKKKWREPLLIEYMNMFNGEDILKIKGDMRDRLSIRSSVEKLFQKENQKGQNQDIFFYQFHYEEPLGHILRMVFYEGFCVLAFTKNALVNEPSSSS